MNRFLKSHISENHAESENEKALMNLRAERDNRAVILEAEGARQSAITRAEGA